MSSSKSQWSGKSRGGALGHWFFLMVIRWIGLGAAYTCLAFVAIYFIPFAPKATAAVWHYNRRFLGYGRLKSAVKVYVHYYIFGQTLIDKMAILGGLSDRFEFCFENYEPFLEQLRQGATTVIGAHMGCWQIGSIFFGEYAKKLNIVMYDVEYQKIKDVVSQGEIEYKIIPVNEGDIESILTMKHAVDRGDYLCFQGDRYVTGAATQMVNFMGGRALFPLGPTMLASKFRVPVIFYFAMRERGRKYRFIFHVLPSGLTQSQIMEHYLTALEGNVRRYPQQWFNFFEVWQRE